jgi:cellulose synthase/poly-beta-1,6-N-acetylglucosamine synthase-like glycosyltransferase
VTTLALPVLAWLVGGTLILFSSRRLMLMVAAWLTPRAVAFTHDLPSVALLVPARDEASGISKTLDAVAGLDYPSDRLFTVLIDDGSRDGTRQLLEQWAERRERTVVVSSTGSQGKIAAMNSAVRATPVTDLIAVCDADVRPQPDWLRRLVGAFSDEAVGGAAAVLLPLNADQTPVSRYAAVEGWAHQLVTSAGKDRLDLNPMTNGASAYRRSALEPLGWFGVGFSEDDVRATVALTRAGWRTRLVTTAIARNQVVRGLGDYWRQHARWSGNLFAARTTPRTSHGRRVGLMREVETWFVTTGYIDRLIFLAALGFAAYGVLPAWVPAVYAGAIVAHVATALAKARTGSRLPAFFFWTVVFSGIDVITSLAALVGQASRGPHVPPRPRG